MKVDPSNIIGESGKIANHNPWWLRYLPAFIRSRFEGRVGLHAVFRNTGWLAADRFLRMGMGLIVGVWVARYLGPAQYGELSYVIAFATFFQVVSLLGLDGVAVRDIAMNRRESAAILGTVFRYRLASSLVCWILLVISMALYRGADRQVLVMTVIVGASFVFQAVDTVDLWFQSQTRSKMTVLAKSFSYVASSLLKVTLILFHAPLLYFAVAGFVESVLSAIALYYSYTKFPAPFPWRYDRVFGRRLLTESWPYLLSGLAIMIYMRIDQIMLREMVGAHEVGIYTAVLPMSTMWYFVPMMVTQSVGPLIAQKKQTDQRGYFLSIKNMFSLMWWIVLPLCIGVALISIPLVKILYGSAYMQSAGVLAIHVFSCIPVALGAVQDLWNLNEKKSSLMLKKALIGVIMNIALNVILIPKYGAIGAAVATVASQAISAVVSNIFFDPLIFRIQVSSLFGKISMLDRQVN